MDKLEKMANKLGQLAEDFEESDLIAHLSEEKQDHAGFVADTFSRYATNYVGDMPENWGEDTVNEVCLYYVVGKVSSEPAFFECYSELLILFFQFLKEKGILADLEELTAAAKKIAKEIPKRAANPKYWHMAKSMMMPAVESGLDLSDEGELDSYMRLQQQQSLQGLSSNNFGGPNHTPIRKGRQIGRNEKVDVEYTDGTIKQGVKYKKVLKDLENGKCSIKSS